MKKLYVTIRGPVSSMKSPMANMIKKAIEKVRPDLSCIVYDHGLFAFRDHFDDELRQITHDAINSPHDVCVIVIGTGSSNNNDPLTIHVEPALPGANIIFNAVTDCLTKDREMDDARSSLIKIAAALARTQNLELDEITKQDLFGAYARLLKKIADAI